MTSFEKDKGTGLLRAACLCGWTSEAHKAWELVIREVDSHELRSVAAATNSNRSTT